MRGDGKWQEKRAVKTAVIGGHAKILPHHYGRQTSSASLAVPGNLPPLRLLSPRQKIKPWQGEETLSLASGKLQLADFQLPFPTHRTGADCQTRHRIAKAAPCSKTETAASAGTDQS
jgi:hypothetical protein